MARAITTPHVGVRLRPGWERVVDPAWREGWHPQPFELAGGTTEVVVAGTGPTVLLVPPLPGYKESWLGVFARLARRFRVVAFDLRGRHPGRPSWDVLLDDLARIADHLAPGAAGVVGHSLGGALAQQWAIRHPERVRALVLSSTFARMGAAPGHWRLRFVEQPIVLIGQWLLPRAPALRWARRLAAANAWVYDPRCDARLLEFVRFCIRNFDARASADAVRLAYAHDTRAGLAGLADALVMVGEGESLFARRAAEDLAARIPGAALVRTPGTNHLHPLSDPDGFAETVTAYLAPRLAA